MVVHQDSNAALPAWLKTALFLGNGLLTGLTNPPKRRPGLNTRTSATPRGAACQQPIYRLLSPPNCVKLFEVKGSDLKAVMSDGENGSLLPDFCYQ
jgi:hypothetical protein